FSTLHVTCVQFCVLFPFFWQVFEWEDRRHRTDGNASAAINTLDGINVKLLNIIEAGTAIVIAGVLLWVNAVYGTGIHAGGILHSNTGLCNHISHRPPPFNSKAMPLEKRIQQGRGGRLLRL